MYGFIGAYELSPNSEGPEDTSKESPSLTETEVPTYTGRKGGPSMSYGEFRVEIQSTPGRVG